MPSLHVPPGMPSRKTGSPSQVGHGRASSRPLCTDDSTRTRMLLSPACGPRRATLMVPVRSSVKRLMTQTGAPPDDTGRIGPLKQLQVSAPAHDDGLVG